MRSTAFLLPVAPGVADEAFRSRHSLAVHVRHHLEDCLLEPRPLRGEPLLRFDLALDCSRQLDRLIGFGQRQFFTAFRAESGIRAPAKLFAHDGAIQRMPFGADDRFIRKTFRLRRARKLSNNP